MNNPFKAISISLVPNFSWRDLWGLIKVKGAAKKLEEELEGYFQRPVVVTESGRNSLYLLLKSWGIGQGDEVIVQGLTCSVVPMAIKAVGLVVKYVDIDRDYNLDLKLLEKNIGSKTKVVIVQHTFGKPVEMDKIMALARKKRLLVVEDLAHGLGNKFEDKKLGQWGDGAILSFGRDKVISGVWGGAVVVKEEKFKKIIDQIQNDWPRRNWSWVTKQLMYLLLSKIVVETYNFLEVGKIMHWLSGRGKYLSAVITDVERLGQMEIRYRGLPDQLAALVLTQFKKLNEMIMIRQRNAFGYSQALGTGFDSKSSYLRYSIEVENPNKLRLMAAKKSIFLGDWYDQVIAPKSIKLENFDYNLGDCPRAEKTASRLVNLPTGQNIGERERLKIIEVVNKWK